MNAKWCISTLLIILSLLGLSQEQTKASNQQILLKFTDVALASDTAHEEVLTAITKKLQVLGIDAIEIVENDAKHVSIRYYSDVDALSVKEFLTQQSEHPLNYEGEIPFELPKEQHPENYNLVVSDLHQQTDNGLSLNGNLVVIQKQDFNTFFNPLLYNFNTAIGLEQDAIARVSLRINKNIALAIDPTSQNIPEVRAGPFTLGNG